MRLVAEQSVSCSGPLPSVNVEGYTIDFFFTGAAPTEIFTLSLHDALPILRVVNSAEELTSAMSAARTEAKAAFGVPDVYLEKYIKTPRHIEFQILGDSFGNIVTLGERE